MTEFSTDIAEPLYRNFQGGIAEFLLNNASEASVPVSSQRYCHPRIETAEAVDVKAGMCQNNV